VIAFVIDENLRLVFQPAEGDRMDDAVAVALERRARRAFAVGVKAAARLVGSRGVGRERRWKCKRAHAAFSAAFPRAALFFWLSTRVSAPKARLSLCPNAGRSIREPAPAAPIGGCASGARGDFVGLQAVKMVPLASGSVARTV
jgi:hypothetical protein